MNLVPRQHEARAFQKPDGRALQACVPGLYAWAVTVAPAAFEKGGSWLALVAGALAPSALVVGALSSSIGRVDGGLGSRLGPRTRDLSSWAFIVACAVVWALVPAELGPRHLDGTRFAAGVVAWALFTVGWAAPPLTLSAGAPRQAEVRWPPRRTLPRGDAVYLCFGGLVAISLQFVGWGATPPERALLVRFVTLASGIGLLAAVAEVAAARHAAPARRRAPIGIRVVLAWSAVALAFLLCGLLVGRLG